MFHKRRQGFAADVMLDPLGIRLGHSRRHTERDEKSDDHFVPIARLLGKIVPRTGKKDRPIRLRCHQAFALKPLKRPAGGHVRHSKPARQVDEPRLTGF